MTIGLRVVLAHEAPRAYARGILYFFGGIRRSTLLRSSSFSAKADKFLITLLVEVSRRMAITTNSIMTTVTVGAYSIFT